MDAARLLGDGEGGVLAASRVTEGMKNCCAAFGSQRVTPVTFTCVVCEAPGCALLLL